MNYISLDKVFMNQEAVYSYMLEVIARTNNYQSIINNEATH